MKRFFSNGAAVIITLGVLFSVVIIIFNITFSRYYQYNNISYTPSQIEKSTLSLVNINTASKDELMTLQGIGDTLALRIIEYRENNGEFKTTYELMSVKGIGEKIFDRIKYYITVE